jgi:hypothetical protein
LYTGKIYPDGRFFVVMEQLGSTTYQELGTAHQRVGILMRALEKQSTGCNGR